MNTDTPERLAELVALARAATSGPWKASTPKDQTWTIWDESGDIAIADIPRHTLANYREDIAYIAAMHPGTFLAFAEQNKALFERLAAAEKNIPATFFADRDLGERVRRLADHWRGAIEANQRLEGRLESQLAERDRQIAALVKAREALVPFARCAESSIKTANEMDLVGAWGVRVDVPTLGDCRRSAATVAEIDAVLGEGQPS